MKKSVFMLSNKEFFIAFEADLDPPYTLDDLIRALVGIVEALPARLRDVWDCCDSRRFDVGFEAGQQPLSKAFDVSREAISLLSNIHAELRITIYSPTAAA